MNEPVLGTQPDALAKFGRQIRPPSKSKTIYLLVGPSGSGKSTLSSYLKEWGVSELVSTTTREPRPGEVEGVNYYYVTPEQFAQIPMIEQTEYAGQLYGTSKQEIERILVENNSTFAIVDRHGVKAFKEIYGDMVKVIYIHAPFFLLIDRMKARNDSLKAIASRVKHALGTNEQDAINDADYCIINLDLGEARRQLRCIVGVG